MLEDNPLHGLYAILFILLISIINFSVGAFIGYDEGKTVIRKEAIAHNFGYIAEDDTFEWESFRIELPRYTK